MLSCVLGAQVIESATQGLSPVESFEDLVARMLVARRPNLESGYHPTSDESM